jgi:predicted nucleic-acid-binding protein
MDWEKLARQTQKETDKKHENAIKKLTQLDTDLINSLEKDYKLNKEEVNELIEIVNNNAINNEQKAERIRLLRHGKFLLERLVSGGVI